MGVASRVWIRRGERPPIHAAGADRRITPALVIFLLIGLLLGLAIAYVVQVRFLTRPTPTLPPLPGRPVATTRGPIVVTVAAAGVVVPERQARLAPKTAGTLVDLRVKAGDTVTAGAVLAKVDAAKLQSKLDDARSQQREAQLNLDKLKAGPRPEEVTSAEAQVQGAQARLAGTVAGPPLPDLAAAQAQANTAAATLRNAQARVDTLTGGHAPPELREAAGEASRAAADLQRAESQLARVKTGGSLDEVKAQDTLVTEARRAVTRSLAGRNLACIRAGGACEAARAVLTTAQATLSQAEAKLQALKTPATQPAIDAAQAEVEKARAAVQSANSRTARVQSGGIPASPDELRQAQAALEQASAEHAGAQAKVEAARQGPKAEDVQLAQSQLVGAQAQLALKRQPTTSHDLALAQERVTRADVGVRDAQGDLDGATLIAPFDGIVTTVNAAVGEQVGPTPVLTLVDPRGLRVEVGLDDADVRRVAVGSPARVTFTPMPDQQHGAKVASIAAEPTIQGGLPRYAVTLTLDDQSVISRPGTAADASVLIAQKENALLVPARAVARSGDERLVATVVDGRPEVRAVQTGLRNEQWVEVTDGLKEGEEVLSPIPATLPGLNRARALPLPTVAIPTPTDSLIPDFPLLRLPGRS